MPVSVALYQKEIGGRTFAFDTGDISFGDAETKEVLKNISTDAVPAPGKVEVGSADRNGTVVGSTRKMMQLLRTIPLNKNAMDQTPAENMIAGATSTESPILADAWNNPIIFVPADGLTGVTTSSGTSTIQSPDRKPFFASAGPDGNFTTGKDNIYSFDK